MPAWITRVPLGCWFGLLLIVLGTWMRDVRGVFVGIVFVVVTIIAVDRRDQKAEEDAAQEAARQEAEARERDTPAG